jgi:hypothetical protein
LDDLMSRGIVQELPSDPLGGQYQIDGLTGAVSASSKRERLRIHEKVACQVRIDGVGRQTGSNQTKFPLPGL